MTDPKYMRSGLDFARGKMIEECGELVAALDKSLRWGWLSSEIIDGETNVEWVLREMRDVAEALDHLRSEIAANVPRLTGRAAVVKDVAPKPSQEIADRDNALKSW